MQAVENPELGSIAGEVPAQLKKMVNRLDKVVPDANWQEPYCRSSRIEAGATYPRRSLSKWQAAG